MWNTRSSNAAALPSVFIFISSFPSSAEDILGLQEAAGVLVWISKREFKDEKNFTHDQIQSPLILPTCVIRNSTQSRLCYPLHASVQEVVDVTPNTIPQRIELWCELEIYDKDGISGRKKQRRFSLRTHKPKLRQKINVWITLIMVMKIMMYIHFQIHWSLQLFIPTWWCHLGDAVSIIALAGKVRSTSQLMPSSLSVIITVLLKCIIIKKIQWAIFW